MKLKKLEKIIKRKKTLMIYEDDDYQWIGDGAALYPLHNLKKLTKDEICFILEITPKDTEKFSIINDAELPSRFNFGDCDKTEVIAMPVFENIKIYGRELSPMMAGHGVFFLDTLYLKPFDDIKEQMTIYERTATNGQPYVVVKNGLFLVGIIVPGLLGENSINDLRVLAENAKAYENYVKEVRNNGKN